MNYTIESREGLKVTVSDLGAEMTGIHLGETEYLWQADPAYWNEHAPVLFPYVGRLTGGKYRIGYGTLFYGDMSKRDAKGIFECLRNESEFIL